LKKGERTSLTKENPGLRAVVVGLGWDSNSFSTGSAFDLDASAFVCREDKGNPKLISDKHFVFYGNKATPNESVKHSGDNLTGAGDGDDESIVVDLSKLEDTCSEISVIVTIYDAVARRQNFGQVRKSYIRILDADTQVELARSDLEEDFSSATAVQFGSLYRKDGGWSFKSVCAGYEKGLTDFVKYYGADAS
jgi:tellurium resistance protein TerD